MTTPSAAFSLHRNVDACALLICVCMHTHTSIHIPLNPHPHNTLKESTEAWRQTSFGREFGWKPHHCGPFEKGTVNGKSPVGGAVVPLPLHWKLTAYNTLMLGVTGSGACWGQSFLWSSTPQSGSSFHRKFPKLNQVVLPVLSEW